MLNRSNLKSVLLIFDLVFCLFSAWYSTFQLILPMLQFISTSVPKLLSTLYSNYQDHLMLFEDLARIGLVQYFDHLACLVAFSFQVQYQNVY